MKKYGIHKAGIPKSIWLCALFVFLFTNLFSLLIFQHIPHINDETAYLFQAKIFKTGRITMDSPCAREFFDFTHMINNGKWYSQYTPGYPFLLMLGLFIGIPWIINPMLAALSVILFYLLGKELYDHRTGILTAILGTVSIWFLVMSSSMMSHTSGLFFCTLFLLYLFRSIKQPSRWNGLVAGAAWGMAFLIRPQAAGFLCIPFLIYYGIRLLMKRKDMLKNAFAMALPVIIAAGSFLAYNQTTNGHPLKMGYEISHGEEHGFGFGRTGYTDIPHTPYRGVRQLYMYLKEMNARMFGWPLSSWLAFIPLMFAYRFSRYETRMDLLLLSGFFAIFLPLFFYWGTFVLIGARMVFEALPILLILSARGLAETPGRLARLFKKTKTEKLKNRTYMVMAGMVLFAFFIKLPDWIWVKESEWFYHGMGNNFARVNPHLHRTIEELVPENSLIMQRIVYHPVEFFPNGWLGSGFLRNDPELSNPVIYTKYIGDNLEELFNCYPDRKIFLYYGTFSKGMVIPVTRGEEGIEFGAPMSPRVDARSKIEIVEDPKQFHNHYSEEFSQFLSGLYNDDHFYDIDVSYLKQTGEELLIRKEFLSASRYFESALQIEKDPDVRFEMLMSLAQCYKEAGLLNEARTITQKIAPTKKIYYYRILPERGF